MKYHSTRNAQLSVTAAQAIAQGLAPDGGLFVPDKIPAVSPEELSALCGMDYRSRAAAIMGKFLDGFTPEEISGFVRAAYGENFDTPAAAPTRFVGENTSFLELWHGPTCAFKDMALQILPHLLTASLKKTGEARQVCILVATSGDTGKAALEGFKDVEGTKIFVFYPADGVSEIQKLQMVTQAGKNVGVCAVKGNFDDAQTGVKRIFSDEDFAGTLTRRGWFLSSANSINWGRLLPQIAYYFSAYCDWVNAGKLSLGEKLLFCVPTGNFGNILAGWYAKQMGLPAARFVCASNENNVLTDFIQTGTYNRLRPFHQTISPSMDILVSSNLERLLHTLSDDAQCAEYMRLLREQGQYTVSPAVGESVRADFSAGFCDDARTKEAIREVFGRENYLMDTHTAVAWTVLADYRRDTGDMRPAAILSTASPFKFAADVLSALGEKGGENPLERLCEKTGLAIPGPLSGLREREIRFTETVPADGLLPAVDMFLS